MYTLDADLGGVSIPFNNNSQTTSLSGSQVSGEKAVVALAQLLIEARTPSEDTETVKLGVFDQTYFLRSELYQHLVRPKNPGTQNINAPKVLEILTKLVERGNNSPEGDFARRALALSPQIFYVDYMKFSTFLRMFIKSDHYAVMTRILESKGILGSILRLPGADKIEILSILLTSPGTKSLGISHALELFSERLLQTGDLKILKIPSPLSSPIVKDTKGRTNTTLENSGGFMAQMKGILTTPIKFGSS